MNRISYYARAALFVARASAADLDYRPYLDRLANRALRSAKVSKANGNERQRAMACDLIAEINAARALLQRGHYRRARMSFLGVASLTAALTRSHAARAHGVNIHAPAPRRLMPALNLFADMGKATVAAGCMVAAGAGLPLIVGMALGVL